MLEEGDDEELYADLYEQLEDGRQVPKTSLLEMEERVGQLTKQTEEMQMKMDYLQKQNDSLQRDKDVLIRNISCLFKTAQMEIARKNKQINELREELSKQNTQELHPISLIATEAQMKTTSEEFQRDKSLNKVENNGVQTNGSRETRHVDLLLEMERCNPYDSKFAGKRSGEKNIQQTRPVVLNSNDETLQAFRDSRRPRTVKVEQRSLEGKHSIQDKHFFKDHHENRKERMSSRHDKFRESHVEEKRVQQVLDIEKDHQNSNDETLQAFRDSRRPRTGEVERRSLEGKHSIQDKHFFKDHHENSKERMSSRHDKLRESHVEEKRVQQVLDIEKDHQKSNDETLQAFRDSRRPRIGEVERRSVEGKHSIQDKHFFKDHHENRKERMSSRHDKFKESHVEEKRVQQVLDIEKDHQITQHRNKDRISYDEFRDNRTSGRTWRDADRMSQRTTNRSMNGSSNFSGDDSHATPKHSAAKRKATDEVYNQKQDSYNDRSSCKVQKSNSFDQNRTDEKRLSNVDAEQQITSKVIEKDCKNDFREDKNRGKVCIGN